MRVKRIINLFESLTLTESDILNELTEEDKKAFKSSNITINCNKSKILLLDVEEKIFNIIMRYFSEHSIYFNYMINGMIIDEIKEQPSKISKRYFEESFSSINKQIEDIKKSLESLKLHNQNVNVSLDSTEGTDYELDFSEPNEEFFNSKDKIEHVKLTQTCEHVDFKIIPAEQVDSNPNANTTIIEPIFEFLDEVKKPLDIEKCEISNRHETSEGKDTITIPKNIYPKTNKDIFYLSFIFNDNQKYFDKKYIYCSQFDFYVANATLYQKFSYSNLYQSLRDCKNKLSTFRDYLKDATNSDFN